MNWLDIVILVIVVITVFLGLKIGIIKAVISLVGVMLVAAVAAKLLKWAASVVMLGWVNHLGGAVFGLVLGGILGGALLATWVKFLGITDAVSQSSLAVMLLDRFPVVLALLPDQFETIRSFFE